MRVTEPATIVELSNALRKKSVLSASRKLASVGWLGKYWTGVLKSSLAGVKAERTAQ